jgi:hypothetical protein
MGFGAIGAHKWRNWTFGVVGILFFLLFYFLFGQENGQTDSTSSVVKQGHHHFGGSCFSTLTQIDRRKLG